MRPTDPRLMAFSRAARTSIAVAVAAGVALAAIVLAQATLLGHVVTAAVQRHEGLAAQRGALTALMGVLVARAALAWLSEAAGHRNAAFVVSSLRMRTLEALVRRGPVRLGEERTGDLVTLTTQGLDSLDAYFARFLPQLVLAGLVPVMATAWIMHTDLVSGAILPVTLPLTPLFMVLVGLMARRRLDDQAQQLGRLGAHFLDVLQGLTTLRIFGRSLVQADRIREVSDSYRRATMSTLRIAFLSALVLETLASLGTALVAVEIGVRLIAGGIGLEAGLVALVLTPEAYLPLRAVGALYHACADGMSAAARALDVIESAPSEPAEPARGAPATTGRRRPPLVRLEGLVYAYPTRPAHVLDGVDFEICPGETVAVVGPSGAGKSTVAALILRLIDPDAGRITADGVDIRELPVRQWRRSVAWVPQRPHLLGATVADNIRLGVADASLEDVRRAAAEAGATEFIEALPLGFDTPLGENGGDLSAGQRQRIALARALLLDAPLLVLDEPMSHLDADAREGVAAAIARAARRCSVLVIGHEHDLAARADRVVRLPVPA